MAVTFNDQYADYDNVKDTFPQSTALTGTISSVNNGELIVGSGTAFTTELQRGEWIYVAAEDEIREIREIKNDTELYLVNAFTSTLSGATPKRVPKQDYTMFSWSIDAAGTAVINGITFPASTSDTHSILAGKRPDPILIDSTGNGNNVYVSYQA